MITFMTVRGKLFHSSWIEEEMGKKVGTWGSWIKILANPRAGKSPGTSSRRFALLFKLRLGH